MSSLLELILIVQSSARSVPLCFDGLASGAELKLAVRAVVGIPAGSQVRMVVGGRVVKEECSLQEQGKLPLKTSEFII